MLNFYYMYGLIWSFVIVLYSFSWSDFNKKLDTGLLLFFMFTILFSFFIGYIRRKKFKYIPCKIKTHKHTTTVLIALGFMLDFLYSRQIPFISIISGQSKYMDFTGIPVLHVFLVAIGQINCFYLFYKYLSLSNKKIKNKLLVDIIIIILMYLLLFSRQILIIIVIGCLIILYSDLKYYKKISINKKSFLAIISILILFLYLFGVLGNLRSGFAWNDCTWIKKIGKFNGKYPIFLPKEFMWAYLYITNPLSNLSNALITNASSSVNIFYYLIPEFVSKRIGGPTYDFWSTSERFNLIADYLNATTGFADVILSKKYTGMIIYYITVVIYSEVVIQINKKGNYLIIAMLVIDIVVIFLFFFNTLSYSGTSLQIVIMLFIGIIKNKKIKFKIKI